MHTPGPWKYSTNVGPTKALIVENDGSTVVEIGNRTHDSRFVHNARLIAAAPDLLEACKVALESSEDEYGGGWTHVNDALRGAIAKAEGR